MSATSIIADIESAFPNITADAKAVLATVLGSVTALQTAVASVGGPLSTALDAASADVGKLLAAGATVAAAATNPTGAIVAIGEVAVSVTGVFEDGFNLAKGAIEGLEGEAAPAGASAAEVEGDAAGASVRNVFEAFADSWKASFPNL